MARTSQTIRNEEGLIYQDWCPKRNVNLEASAAVVAQYFQETWREDVTEERLEQAFDALKPHLTFLSPKEIEVRKQGAEDPELAKKLADWLETKQTFLEKEGENGFANFSELYQELRGRDISKDFQTLVQQAIGRIEAPTSRFDTRVRRPLHYLKVERQMSPAAQADDPNRKPGEFISKQGMKRFADGSWGKDYAAERAANAAKNNLTATDSVKLLEAQAQQAAESIRGNSAQQDRILSRTYVTRPGTSDIDWVQTLQSRRVLLRNMVKEAMTNRSVR